MKSLEELCLTSYLCFLESECKAWIDITASGSRLLQVVPSLRGHLAAFLSGTASSNLRQRMFEEIISGAFPSPRYRNSVEGSYQGQPVNFGLYESFHRVHEDVTRHSARCARLCCTGVFIVEAMLKVVINDELRELVLPTDLQSSIWGQDQRGFHDGGIESVVPFHYPALLSTYTESLLFPSPSEGGLLLRTPALKKLKIGNFEPVLDLRRNPQNWELMKSFQLTRQYLQFLPHLGPPQKVFSLAPSHSFDWPIEDKSGVLPTLAHAAFATKTIFDFFSPKSVCNLNKFANLTEISLNNSHCLLGWDLRGIELFSAMGKAVPRLRVLDLSDTQVFTGELLLYLIFHDAFWILHRYMYLHDYRVLSREEQELAARTGPFRTVAPDLQSPPALHTFSSYCPWCLDEGAYHDNLRPGCSQEFLPITVVEDRLADFVESLSFDESLKGQSLLHCIRVSDLVSSLEQPAKILIRDSSLLPYEPGFQPEPGTEQMGEPDGSLDKPHVWFPPAKIRYEEVEDEEYGIWRLNPLVETLQAIKLPAFSRSLWGELIPFLLQACPNLLSLGKASGTLYGLQILESMKKRSGLQDVFIHLDLLSTQDYHRLLENPGYGRIGNGDTLCQNSPSLRFLVQNFGPTALQTVQDTDDQETILRKEFALEVWDQAKLLLPEPGVCARVDNYLELIVRQAPQTRSLSLLTLSRSPDLNDVNWQRLLELPHLSQLTLQVSRFADFSSLLAALGPKLKWLSITEMIGDRETPEPVLVEGLNMEEQSGLYVCEKCPNAEVLDLVHINVGMKFFFGRRFSPQPRHFHQLTELSIGKVDWETFKQVWSLSPALRKLLVTVIVPIFTLSEQLYEEPLVMTEEHVKELQHLNPRLRKTLEEVRVASLRFATFAACHLFLNEFSDQLKKVGSIDAETFNQTERKELTALVKRFASQGVEIKCCDIFNFDF